MNIILAETIAEAYQHDLKLCDQLATYQTPGWVLGVMAVFALILFGILFCPKTKS